jgi:hypothetical protein
VDFDEYVAARYGRLIEHAVLLGCAEGEAGTQVDRVLIEQRKAIRRAEDPDPLVHDALERAISGTPERSRSTGPWVALGVVAAAAGVAFALTYRPAAEPMPSLFALRGTQAQQLLEDRGFDVVLRPARACEPMGLVLGTDPPTGDPVSEGATVTVRTAVPSGTSCDAEYAGRSDAWQFVSFALGSGPAPAFTRTVTVVVDRQDPYRIDHAAAVDRARWGGVLDRIARTAATRSATASGMPSLTVRSNLLPSHLCGVPKPPGTGDRRVLRIEIDTHQRDARATECPLTVDLYRDSERAIDGVVVYTPKVEQIRPAGRLRRVEPAGE